MRASSADRRPRRSRIQALAEDRAELLGGVHTTPLDRADTAATGTATRAG